MKAIHENPSRRPTSTTNNPSRRPSASSTNPSSRPVAPSTNHGRLPEAVTTSNHHRQSKLEPSPQLSKIYFENFPNGYDNFAMKRVFKRIGVFDSVYVARRRNQRNLNFGFLTMVNLNSVRETLYRMNSISIGIVKLRAYRVKYSRFPTVQEHKPARRANPVNKPIFRESLRGDRSYANVVSNNGKKNSGDVIVNSINKALPKQMELLVETAPWKANACLAKLHSLPNIKIVSNLLVDRGFLITFAASAWGENVIIGFESAEMMKSFVNDDWRILNHVFSDVSLLSIDFFSNNCILYLDLFGIPPSVVSEPLVRKLASNFGSIITLDSDFSRPERLDVVSCLMSVPIGSVGKVFSITVGATVATIYAEFRQGVGCNNCEGKTEAISGDSDGNSSASGESETDQYSSEGAYDQLGDLSVQSEQPSNLNCCRIAETTSLLGSRSAPPTVGGGGLSDFLANGNANLSPSSSGPDIMNMNRVILRASDNDQRFSEELLTFKVGERIGIFYGNHVDVVVRVLEESLG